jgi:hypothetical protein
LLTKALVFTTIAEWAQNRNTHQPVAKLGVILAQGYYHGVQMAGHNPGVLESNITGGTLL